MLGRSIKQQQITRQQAEAQMQQFLYGCRPHVLASLTVDDLLRSYRVKRKVAEYALVIAKQKRAGE